MASAIRFSFYLRPMRISLVFLAGLAAVGCGPAFRPADYPLATGYPLLPVVLNPDTTVLVIADFLPDGTVPDSVVWDDDTRLAVDSGPDGPTVTILGAPKLGIGMLRMHCGTRAVDLPVLRSDIQTVTLTRSFPGAQSVTLTGAVNGWNAEATPFVQTASGWELELELPAGVHPYRLVVDGAWRLDPEARDSMPNGMGAFNSVLEVGAGGPVLEATDVVETDSGTVVVCSGSAGAALFAWWENSRVPAGKVGEDGKGYVRLPDFADQTGRAHLRVWAANAEGTSPVVLLPLQDGHIVRDPAELTRTDRHATVMYFLMVDRFINGSTANDGPTPDASISPKANRYGGDFAGIQQALETGYFDSLGINTLWISPITRNPDDAWGLWKHPDTDVTSRFSGYHGYWPIRLREIDPRFGTKEEFDGLVGALHAKQMNVLVDYVAHHVHEQHPMVKEHPDWYTDLYLPDGSLNTERWDDHRLTTWFDVFLPTLDVAKPEVCEAMTDSALWWVLNSDIDGFRHDATKHIPEGFWRMLTRKIRTQAPGRPLFQIGETYGSTALIRSYVHSGMLDAQFDFNHYDAAVAALGLPGGRMEDLVRTAQESLRAYGADHAMGNISGNQDRPRFTSLADGSIAPGEDTKYAGWTRSIQHANQRGFDRMRLLMAYLMASPGIPCIYYGDEIADVGANDPDNRRPFRSTELFDEELRTRDWTAAWVKLRRSRMSMMYGSTAYAVLAPGLLRIDRTYLGERTIVLINSGEAPVRVTWPEGAPRILAGNGTAIDGAIDLPVGGAVAVAG